jgi:hypothetical protein
MKFFKKITTFKGSKAAEKEVGLAVPSVAVVSAVALHQPVVSPERQSSDSVATAATLKSAVKEDQNISQVLYNHDTRHVAEEIVETDSINEDDEYRKAIEDNIYLKEKNSLLLQLVI